GGRRGRCGVDGGHETVEGGGMKGVPVSPRSGQNAIAGVMVIDHETAPRPPFRQWRPIRGPALRKWADHPEIFMLQAQQTPPDTITPVAPRKGIKLSINGDGYQHTGDPDMPLIWYLRDILRLTGCKYGCDKGECGACTVHVD